MPDQEPGPAQQHGGALDRLGATSTAHRRPRVAAAVREGHGGDLRAAGLRPATAVEIGFGDGTESVALLRAGWHVTAIDPHRRSGRSCARRFRPTARRGSRS